MRFFAFLLVASLAAPSTLAQRGRPPGQRVPPPGLLRKVFEARNKVRYTGIRVVQHLEGGERKVVTERVWRDGFRVRMETADGPLQGQIAVEDENKRLVWSPNENVIRETPAREAEFMHRMGKMGGGPGRAMRPIFEETDGGKIAGVPTRLLELKMPNGTVVSQLWIDPHHGAVLKFQSFDRAGKRNGYLEFTSIKFDQALTPGLFEIKKPGAKIVSIEDDLKRLSRELGIRPYRIPAGGEWRLVGVRKFGSDGTQVLMEHYKGARARVSLFLIKGEINVDRLKRMQRDGANSHVWERDGIKLALIGDLPPEGLRRLASQVTP